MDEKQVSIDGLMRLIGQTIHDATSADYNGRCDLTNADYKVIGAYAERLLDQAAPSSRGESWTNAGDQLPPLDVPVLCETTNANLAVLMRSAGDYVWQWAETRGSWGFRDAKRFAFGEHWEVNFWRPLPEAPGAIDNDDDKLKARHAIRAASAPKTCSWVYRNDDDCWEMSCGGDEWCFNDGGVVENRIKYCVNCGRPVLIASGELQKANHEDD